MKILLQRIEEIFTQKLIDRSDYEFRGYWEITILYKESVNEAILETLPND